MKHFLPLLFFLLLQLTLTAQVQFAEGEGDLVVDVNPANNYQIVQAVLQNQTDQVMVLKWVMRTRNLPAEWQLSVGDSESTYAPSQQSRLFFMNPGESLPFHIYVYPNGYPGNGIVDVSVRNADNGKLLDKISLTFREARMQSVPLEEDVKIYPNPAQEYFMIETGAIVGKVELYNVVAEKIRTIYSYQRQFFVGDLDPGMYFIRVLDVDNRVIKTIRLRKEGA